MAKIGIFGGTFDPFTLAHREIAKQAIVQLNLDLIYICPTIVTWHRKEYVPWLDGRQKVEVIKRMCEDDSLLECKARICEDDLKLQEMCKGNAKLEEHCLKDYRFIDTLLKVKSKCQADDELYVIIGPDEFSIFEKWYAYESILKMVKKLVVVTDEHGNGRNGKPVAAKDSNYAFYGKVIALPIDSKFMKMSASKCRKEFTSYENYIAVMKSKKVKDCVLLHTPIFDVVKGKKAKTGLEPILVNAPDWATVIVEKKGKFLVEKQYRYGMSSNVEEFPCGMVEKSEDPLDAALRELREETGLNVIDKHAVIKIGQASPNPAFMTNTMHYFYVNLDKAKFTKEVQHLDEHEDIKFWFEDMDKFCQRTMDKAKEANSKIPAMLVTAIALFGMWKMVHERRTI